MTLGKRIQTARLAKGLSQSQFEKVTGIKREYISKLENDELKNPTYNTLLKIAKGCGLTLVEFFDGKQQNATDFELAKTKINLAKREEELDKVYSALETLVSGRGK